jgi:hypothetical protein
VLFSPLSYAADNGVTDATELCDKAIKDISNSLPSALKEEDLAVLSAKERADKIASHQSNFMAVQLKKLAACNNLDLTQDLSIQMLLMMLGEDVVWVLDFITMATDATYDEDEARRLANMFTPLHTVIGVANMLFFGIFVLFALIKLTMHGLRWQKGDFDKDMKSIFNQDISSIGLNAMLLTPLVTLSMIQVLLVLTLCCTVYLGKPIVNVFFAGNLKNNVIESIRDDFNPNFTESITQNAGMYLCDIERRDHMVNQIVLELGTSKKLDVEKDELYKCLQGDYSSIPFKNSGLVTSKSVAGVDNVKMNAYTTFLPKQLSHTEMCYSQHKTKKKYKSIKELVSCGEVTITTPVMSNDIGNAGVYIGRLRDIYLSDELQSSISQLAGVIYQSECQAEILIGSRLQHSDNEEMRCLIRSVSATENSLSYTTDDITQQERISIIATPLTPSEKSRLDQQRQLKTVEITNYLKGNSVAIYRTIRDAASNVEGDGLASEKDLIRLRQQMERGQWLAGGLFLSDLQEEMTNVTFKSDATSSYKSNIGLYGSSASSQFRVALGYITSSMDALLIDSSDSIIPSPKIYASQLECWRSIEYCHPSAINPFAHMNKVGAQHIWDSLAPYVITKFVLGWVDSPSDIDHVVRNRFEMVKILENVFFVELLLGIVLAVIIPLIPVFFLLGMMVSWAQDFLRATILLQVQLCSSPLGNLDQRLFSEEVRGSFAQLVILAIHLFFTLIGVVVCFLVTSFFFSLNIIVIGIFTSVVGLDDSSGVINSAVMRVVYDCVVVVVLFLEVKFSAEFIRKIPEALAMHFNVQLSRDDGIGKELIDKLRGQMFPEIAKMFGRFQ